MGKGHPIHFGCNPNDCAGLSQAGASLRHDTLRFENSHRMMPREIKPTMPFFAELIDHAGDVVDDVAKERHRRARQE